MPKERDPTAIEVFAAIADIARDVRRSLLDVLSRHDLTLPGYGVLAALRRSGSPYALTPTELSRATRLTTGAMTSRIDRLERDGLVERVRSPDDRRSVIVRLTPEGRARIDRALPAWDAAAERVLARLGRAEARELHRLLGELWLAVDGDRKEPVEG